ncbi:hypothetical protein LMJF_10_0660 [Leishmania major strain Friedlin]|uniref:Uncharacterized protein n=1 Tax=Leishmania major TaxID=5664 RepID=Q4QHE9_LEIMA|nr:hypothetical protein LMJF_10_0660 [Leishmania major strain Friedlin]CAG9570047.1 hypothetical_protein_-_conserved [Leishmania major strain Friedlin]CAJ02714.1 hypothetical protein LMJF_10_0660 [Leishmania major strain Friedlin]|eukprot:XP_001681399.1 hypothetical protein LMJF_10_0660 [Leishmania major strain Friedlin]
MNPLDYLPPDVFTHTWGAPTRAVQTLGSHVCVVSPRYERMAVAIMAVESIEPAPPPQFEVVCTGHTRTFLPTPHPGSCPLDYTALFVTLHRRQSEKITCRHASRPVPLLASGSPGIRQLHEAFPSAAAGGWVTARTPPSPAAAYASQNVELGIRGRRVEDFATSAGRSTPPPSGSLEGRLAVVERPVPESVAVTPVTTAALSIPVGTVHHRQQQQQHQSLGTGQPYDHHQRRPRPDPQRMQYRVGRSGSTQPPPLPNLHGGTPSNTGSATTPLPTQQTEEVAPQPLARLLSSLPPSPAALPRSPAIASSASTSMPRDSTSFVSLAASSLRPSVSRAISTETTEATALPSNIDRHYILMRRDSSFLAGRGDTPGEAAMEDVQQSRWLLSRHPRQRASSGNADAVVDEVGAGAHGEVGTRERLQQQLQRTLERQRQRELLTFDFNDGLGDARGPQQRTAEHMFLSPDASGAHWSASEGPRRGRAAAAAPYVFRGTGADDNSDEIRADSVAVARGLPLASAQTRSRGSTSPSPQQHDLPLWWRRGQAARGRQPQPDAAQQGHSDDHRLSPSPAAAVGEDAHPRHTGSAPQRTSGASSPTPASSVVVSRSAAPRATSASTCAAQMLLSPSVRVDRGGRSASLHVSLSFATAGVVDVDDTIVTSSCAVLPSPIPVDHLRRPSLPNAALTDVVPSSRMPSEEAYRAEGAMCLGDSSRRVSALAHPRNSVSCFNNPAVDAIHVDAVTAAAMASTVGHRAWKLGSRCSSCPSASATGRTAASERSSRDDFDFERSTSEPHQDGVFEEDAGAVDEETPFVRRTSPGTRDDTSKESSSQRSSDSPGAAEPQGEIFKSSASAGGRGDDCVRGRRSRRDPRLPPLSCAASLSPSSSSSPAPWHARTDTKAGGMDVDAAVEEADEAAGSTNAPALAATTSPMVYLCDMLRLSFSPDNGADNSRTVGAEIDEAQKAQRAGTARVGGVQGRYTCGPDNRRRHSRTVLTDDDDDSSLCRSAASTSSSPPSQSRTAIRRLMDMEDAVVSDGNLSASPPSLLDVTRGRCGTAASTTTTGPSACTPHRVAGRLALTADERRLQASTASTVAWGRANGSEHSHRGAAAAVVTATPEESSARSSILSIFSTPAQTRLQSLLQASTWSTATPCSHEQGNSNHSSRRSAHRRPQVAHATSTGGRTSPRATREDSDDVEDEIKMGTADQNPYGRVPTAAATASARPMMPCDQAKRKCDNGGLRHSPGKGHEPQHLVRQGEKGGEDGHVRGSSNSSSSMTPTRLSGVYASPAAARASATVIATPSRTAVAEAAPASASPLHPSPFRSTGSFLQVYHGWRGSTSTAAPSGANWLSLSQEADIQLLARTTRLTHARGGSTTGAMTPKVCDLARSPQQPPPSPPSSPSRRSTGSLSFFLAAAAASPGSGGGTRTSGGGGFSEDDEGRGVRAAGSAVYGSAVARRRSWAPRKQQQKHRWRQQSHSSMGMHSPSVSVRGISRTDSSGSRFSEAFGVAPQRLTFGSAIASVSVANSNTDSVERWPGAYSTPTALALSHPRQQRQHRAPLPPYAFSPGDACRRGDGVEEAAESSRHSLLLSSEQPTASPRPSWALSTSSPLSLSPFAPRTPSGRLSLPSTEFNQAPLRHGETRVGFSTRSPPSTSIASAAEQRTQHVRGSSRRSRRRANRALSFSTLRSSPSALATPTVWAGVEYTLGAATPLGGRIDAPSPSPLNSGRHCRTSSDGSMTRSMESVHIASSGRSRASASLMLQLQPVQPRISSTAPQPTLADELRLFASPVLPTAPIEPLVSSSSATAPLPLTTFIASPPGRTGPPTSTIVPPSTSSLVHSPRQRPSLPPELLALMQMRTSASSTSAAAAETHRDPGDAPSSMSAQPAESGAMAPPCAFASYSTTMQRRGCSERRDVNVEPGQGSPSSPHRPGSSPTTVRRGLG